MRVEFTRLYFIPFPLTFFSWKRSYIRTYEWRMKHIEASLFTSSTIERHPNHCFAIWLACLWQLWVLVKRGAHDVRCSCVQPWDLGWLVQFSLLQLRSQKRILHGMCLRSVLYRFNIQNYSGKMWNLFTANTGPVLRQDPRQKNFGRCCWSHTSGKGCEMFKLRFKTFRLLCQWSVRNHLGELHCPWVFASFGRC